MRTVTLATALGTGVVGGVFVGFSDTVAMPGLDRLPRRERRLARAMQAINVTAPRGLAVPLVVSGLGSLAVCGWAFALVRDGSARALLVAGALTGVVALGVTAAYHVPRDRRARPGGRRLRRRRGGLAGVCAGLGRDEPRAGRAVAGLRGAPRGRRRPGGLMLSERRRPSSRRGGPATPARRPGWP